MTACRKHYAGMASIAATAIARATRVIEGCMARSEQAVAMSRAEQAATARRIGRPVAMC